MKTLSVVIVILFCFYGNLFSQENYVNDPQLDTKLRKYLLERVDLYTFDDNNNKIPYVEAYANTLIASRNLKTDSIIKDKSVIGFYSCKYANITSRPHLYIQYPDRIEFILLDDKNFDLNKLMLKIIDFFNEYSASFSPQERVKTVQGIMETIYYNKFAEISW